MSRTYSFICDDCKKACWAGQSNFIYKYQYIADFLHEHKGHHLKFVYDEHIPIDYKEDQRPYEKHT